MHTVPRMVAPPKAVCGAVSVNKAAGVLLWWEMYVYLTLYTSDKRAV